MSRDTVIVAVIVAVAVLWALRAVRRAVTRKKVCSSCGSSGDCPLANGRGGEDAGPLPSSGSCAYPPGGSSPEKLESFPR